MKKYVLKKHHEPENLYVGIFMFAFLLPIIYVIFWHNFFRNLAILNDIWIGRIILIVLVLAPLYIFYKMFLRKGVLIIDNRLYTADFLFGRTFFKEEMPLVNITDITFLNFTNSTFLKPSWDKVYLLNRNHSHKSFVLVSVSRAETLEFIKFLANNLHLNYTKYNPPRSRKRR